MKKLLFIFTLIVPLSHCSEQKNMPESVTFVFNMNNINSSDNSNSATPQEAPQKITVVEQSSSASSEVFFTGMGAGMAALLAAQRYLPELGWTTIRMVLGI